MPVLATKEVMKQCQCAVYQTLVFMAKIQRLFLGCTLKKLLYCVDIVPQKTLKSKANLFLQFTGFLLKLSHVKVVSHCYLVEGMFVGDIFDFLQFNIVLATYNENIIFIVLTIVK